jgi:eukaryotic-like serine/threonine-protein kinase
MQSREPGQLLSGKYQLIRLLGQGGMGSVWHAHHLTLNAPVALKFIESEELDGAALQRFLGEARMVAALRSPHVVQILDYGVDDQTPHFAMELLEGETLATRLKRQGPLGFQQTLRVVQHVARAIARAHDAGVIHRDLKPANVFIVSNDDDELIKVLDFGIAKSTRGLLADSAAVSTRSGATLGTPSYMSPEQLDADQSIDARTDIWALGVLAYQCLLGKLPFAGDSLGQVVLSICSRPMPVPSLRGAVPAGFDAWFARACARDLGARFATARQAAIELAALSGGAAVATPSNGAAEAAALAQQSTPEPELSLFLGTTAAATSSEASRPPPRRRLRYALAALGVLLLAAVAGIVGRTREAGVAPAALEPPANPASVAPAATAPPIEAAVAPQVESAAALPIEAAVAPPAEAVPPPPVVPRPMPAAASRPSPKAATPRPALAPRAPSPAPAGRAEPRRSSRIPEVPPANFDLGI